MSGLESIALAVAHLEEQQHHQQEEQQDSRSTTSDGNNDSYQDPAAEPAPATSSPPPALPQASPLKHARVVSVDDVVTPSATPSKNAPKTNPTSSAGSSTTFGYILADPLAWLQKTQDRPPLKPPSETTIDKIEATDVLCGRGGETNHHPGNIQYRLLVKAFQPLYVSAKRREKPLIAQCIVYSVRQVGGRFLKRRKDKEWEDVGNTKAREKTSQALREGAPELRGDGSSQGNGSSISSDNNNNKKSTTSASTSAMPQQSFMSAVEARLFAAYLSSRAAATPSANGHSSLPPQGPTYHPVMVSPTESIMMRMMAHNPTASNNRNNKRDSSAVIISDGHSDSESSSISSQRGETGGLAGPRLKRFKQRFQEESTSMKTTTSD
eukprot:scaffold5810_cov109-Cylindrotheca_fusiformis.AAC.1